MSSCPVPAADIDIRRLKSGKEHIDMKHVNTAPQVADDVFVAHNAVIIGDARIESGASVWYNAVIRADNNYCIIGECSNIQDGVIVHCDEDYPVILGKNVTIGHGAVIHSASIDDNSLIGMGAIVLNGAHIGKNCLIGAGALVTGGTQIPDGSMVVGAPAKVKRALTEDEIAGLKENADEYTEAAAEYKAGRIAMYNG